MKREDAIRRLRDHRTELESLGVEHLFLFGSTSRDEADESSDVDLFFDHARGQLGLYEVMDVMERAATILGHNVDVMTRASLHPALKDRIEAAAIAIF